MTPVSREHLSALVDGEGSGDRVPDLVETIARDEELKRLWGRYHLISDAMRGHLTGVRSDELFQGIRQRVGEEPSLYRLDSFRRRVLKPLAGLAVAASVAVVAVLGVRTLDPAGDARGVTVAEVSAPVSVPATATARADVADPRLSAYIVNHSGSAGRNVQGLLPYARIVAYDAGR
jgi:sigma-E factor negative regulatory protein RseA